MGRLIGAQAGGNLKRVTLELGGHAPAIVCDDADADLAGRAAAAAKIRNAGQVCISPTRFLVQDGVHDRFVAALARGLEGLRIGPGLDAATQLGPLANARRAAAVDALVADAVGAGARAVLTGARPNGRGHFRHPVILADVPLTSRAMNDEPFGPVALVNRFATLDEAIGEANRLPYGLAAYAFTRDRDRAARIQGDLESGLIGMNGFSVTWPETPFGGVKDSGHGSEGGSEGMDAYLATKFVHDL